MKTFHRYFALIVIVPLVVFLGSCAKTAENEHLPEYCQSYSGFMSTASKDLYDLIGGINRYNYLSVISEIELEFEVDDPTREINLDGIQCFQNLTSLTLIGQSFKDISPISALKNIQKIVLIDTAIVSIDSFKNLSKVNELTISNTKTLQSVDGVEEMTKLTRLDLSDNGIVNIDGLNNLVNLTELILSNNKITFFPSINQLELLVTLDVSNNSIVEFGEDLSGLRNLVEFNARHNNICDISSLDDLISIEILDLSENRLGCGGVGVSPDFSSLEYAPYLREIYLNDNNLSSIEDLRGKNLPLEVLHLENNNITDITPIGNYTGIKELVLYNNNITNIDNLSGMTTLTEIDLSDNSITNFSDLLSIPNLEFINLSNNNITFIPLMSTSWPNLKSLNLDSNDLINTAGVEGHSSLRELILSNNGLTELAGISHLPLLENLVLHWEISEYVPEDNPNSIRIIRDSFNSLPLIDLVDETGTFDFGFDLGPHVEIYNSLNDIDGVSTIDFSGMDIDYIDSLSINLSTLLAIDVSDNNITDITFILGNPNLQILDISGNGIENLSLISGVTTTDLDNLDQIDASDIYTSNDLLNAFIELPELSYLDLTGTDITSINNCFNNLNELTNLEIDSPVLVSIVDSFNDLYAIHTVENVITFSDNKIGEIRGSFNNGMYEQIVFQNNNPDDPLTGIINSFNNLNVENTASIVFTGNDFKTITGSFNDTVVVNLFLVGNSIEEITTSFVNLNVSEELNLHNNKLTTLVGLNSVLMVSTLNLSNNLLTTVAFLDGITGLTSLDISNQYDSGVSENTLTVIDGINNMGSLIEVIMEDMLITEIDGFKNIGITDFELDVTDNNGGQITMVSPTSFLNSKITSLDLSGHELENIEFLSNFTTLIDLNISINMADLSDFQGMFFEGTLQSFTLENIQEVTDFHYLSGYDLVNFFSFTSDSTLTINNFNGLDSLTNANFNNKANITTISNSFNSMSSLSLSTSYLTIYPNLADISNSFGVYDASDRASIGGNIIIVDSFNNLGTVDLDSGANTSVNFDANSFTNMHTIIIGVSNYNSYDFLDGYTALRTVEIQNLNRNITDLSNNLVTSVNIVSVVSSITTLTIDIANTGSLSFGSNVPITVNVTADNANYDFSSVDSTVTLDVDNSEATFEGVLDTLIVNSTNLVNISLNNIETTNMIFNTALLARISRLDQTAQNADILEVNSLVTSITVDARANTLNINDNNANTYNLTVPSGDVNIYTTSTDLTIDFIGEDLNIAYDTLETIIVNGDLNNLIVDSNNLDDINLNETLVNGLDITSLQSTMNIVGTNVKALQLTNNNLTDSTLILGLADVTVTSTSAAPLNVNVNASSLDLEMINLPSLVFDNTSSLLTLDLTDGVIVGMITYNQAVITNTHLISDETIISLTGVNVINIDLDADNLTNLLVDAPSAILDVDTLTTVIAGDIIATEIAIDGANLTDIILTATSLITTMNILNSIAIDTLSLDTANITTLNVDSDVQNLDISAINSLETAVSGDNYISVITDLGTNDLIFTSLKTTSISFDIIADDVILNTLLSAIIIDNTSNITNLSIASDTLTNIFGGSATITTLDITGSSSSLNVTGSNITSLTVDDPLITTFNANVGLTTEVDFSTNTSALITINSSSEDITITASGPILLTSDTLMSSTVNIGNNDATFNLTKTMLDYTLFGTMGDINIISATMNTFTVGSGLIVNSLGITNDNITSLDLSAGTISNLELTSACTTIYILGNSLATVLLDMDNLINVTVNSSLNGSTVYLETSASTLSINGTVDNYNVVGASLSSIDLNGVVGSVNITGDSLTSVDLTDAAYNNLVLNCATLGSLDTLLSVSDSLEVTSGIDNFSLTSVTPIIDFIGNAYNNLNLETTVAAMALTTTVDSVTLVAPTTEISVSGANLNNIIGTIQNINLTNETGGVSFVFDLDADSVVFSSNTPATLLFTGVRIISEIEITSTSITTLNTNDVVITTLSYTSSGVNTTVDTRADIVNHTNTTGDEIVFNIDVDSQVLNTNSDTITLSSSNISSMTLNYFGTNALDITLTDLTTVTINASLASTIIFNGNSTNVILSGVSISAVDTASLILANKYTMNDTLITDLEFMSAGLIASLTDIEVNTLIEANVGNIITKLDSSGVTLVSPITSQHIYDYFYSDEYTALTDQEAIDTVRYDGFRDTAIADALAVFRGSTYYDYILDTELESSIDIQTYDTMQNYFDGYGISEGYVVGEFTIEEQMVTDLGQAQVNNIKAEIQGVLDNILLIIVEDNLNASVVTSIEDDSTTYATTESGSIGFNIG